MTLIEHINSTRLSKKVYAEEVGISRPTLYRILNGDPITLDVAKKIVEYSKSKVGFKDLANG